MRETKKGERGLFYSRGFPEMLQCSFRVSKVRPRSPSLLPRNTHLEGGAVLRIKLRKQS